MALRERATGPCQARTTAVKVPLETTAHKPLQQDSRQVHPVGHRPDRARVQAAAWHSNTGTEGPLTSAERVAILDRQLEESTRDFDGIIYDEEQRQREADRARTAQTNESPAQASETAEEESTFGGGVASTGSSSVGGGIGGSRGNAPPTDGAKYPPPGDIPAGNDDDVVARQLREAAMRESDPEVREKLWNEYRKYKGIEVPAS